MTVNYAGGHSPICCKLVGALRHGTRPYFVFKCKQGNNYLGVGNIRDIWILNTREIQGNIQYINEARHRETYFDDLLFYNTLYDLITQGD